MLHYTLYKHATDRTIIIHNISTLYYNGMNDYSVKMNNGDVWDITKEDYENIQALVIEN